MFLGIQTFVFDDASELALASVACFRDHLCGRHGGCQIYHQKCTSSHIQTTTIPNLELQATVKGANFAQIVKTAQHYGRTHDYLDRQLARSFLDSLAKPAKPDFPCQPPQSHFEINIATKINWDTHTAKIFWPMMSHVVRKELIWQQIA